jgi:hypothetical protein
VAVTFDTTLGGIDELYAALGYERQPEFWSLVSGHWLDSDANG